jgi:hypothetical protein
MYNKKRRKKKKKTQCFFYYYLFIYLNVYKIRSIVLNIADIILLLSRRANLFSIFCIRHSRQINIGFFLFYLT